MRSPSGRTTRRNGAAGWRTGSPKPSALRNEPLSRRRAVGQAQAALQLGVAGAPDAKTLAVGQPDLVRVVAEEEQFGHGIQVDDGGVVDALEAVRREQRFQLGQRVIRALLPAVRRLRVDLLVTGEEADDLIEGQE